MENNIENIVEESSLRPPINTIIVNGRRKVAVNGVVSLDIPKVEKKPNVVYDIDDDCFIIEVCRRLDLSKVGNVIYIQLPEGYVCDPRGISSLAKIFCSTYGSDQETWTTPAAIEYSYVLATSGGTSTAVTNITNDSGTDIDFTPFVKDYIKITVVSACVGAVNPYAVFTTQIVCHKE